MVRTSTLASPPKLTSASTLLTIRDIPPQLWSQEAVTMIAGGVAKLIPGMRASLPFSSLGTATIRAIVPLGSPLPSSVMVKDAHGSSVLVSIDYGRLPHLCSICSSYGHQSHRCLQRKSATNPIPPKLNSKSLRKAEPASIPETAQISISQDAVIVVGQSSSSIVPLINDPASPEHKMELDTVVSEQVILDAATENPSVPASTKSSKMSTVLDSHKVSMVNAMDSSSQNLLQEKSPTLVAEVPNQSMDLDTTAAPESEDQTMELDSKPCKDLVLKVSSTSHHVFTSSPSLPDDAQQVIQSSSKDGPSSLQPSLCLSSQSQTLLELSSNGDSNPHPVPVPSANLSEAHQHDHSSSQSTNKDHTAITFSFPPPVIHEMEVKNDHIQSLSSPDISALDHHSKVKIEDKSKEVGSRNKTQVKLASALLKCKKEISQFKPKGIVEKRRKKMQNGMVLEADELQQGLQEMESDKKNTTYYEAILAHKISGNPDIVTEETLET